MREGASRYRGDIDGLRALAIIPVVAFHAGAPGFGGGFVGVDIFFVISGFLITGLLLDEVAAQGRVRLLDFYARRVRRILPALTLVALACAVAGPFLLSAGGDQQRLARSLLASAGFLSNVLFWRQQGNYFAPQAEVQPLLHTWTLAVEEQFYLVWPLVIIAVVWLARRIKLRFRPALTGVLAAGIVLSFALSLIAMRLGPAGAFYLSPPRAWELGLGAILALIAARPAKPGLAGLIATAGLAALAYAVFAFDDHTLFPDVAALAPTLGAAALIWAGSASPDNLISRGLAAAPLRWIGRRSYSWYLWHWPLLAFGRVQTLGEPSLARDLILSVVALGLACLTYTFVEQPIHRRRVWPFNSIRNAIVSGLVLLALTGAAGAALLLHARSAASAMDAQILAAQKTSYGRLNPCHVTPQKGLTLLTAQRCSFGDTTAPAAVLLWGDSFAQHLLPALQSAGQSAHVRVIERSAMSCRPYRQTPRGIGSQLFVDKTCIAFNHAVSASLPDLRRSGVRGVILAAQWRTDPPGDLTRLRTQVDALTALGFKVVIVLDPPGGRIVSPTCLAYRAPGDCRLDRTRFEQARATESEAMNQIAAANPQVRLFDPAASLCQAAVCPATANGHPLYRDDHHMTLTGAGLLAPAMSEALTWLAAP